MNHLTTSSKRGDGVGHVSGVGKGDFFGEVQLSDAISDQRRQPRFQLDAFAMALESVEIMKISLSSCDGVGLAAISFGVLVSDAVAMGTVVAETDPAEVLVAAAAVHVVAAAVLLDRNLISNK